MSRVTLEARQCSLSGQSLSDYSVGVLATPGDVSSGTPLWSLMRTGVPTRDHDVHNVPRCDAMRTIPDVDHHYPQHHWKNAKTGAYGRRFASESCYFRLSLCWFGNCERHLASEHSGIAVFLDLRSTSRRTMGTHYSGRHAVKRGERNGFSTSRSIDNYGRNDACFFCGF